MKHVPVTWAERLKSEGMAWRDVAQELAWATGRKFSFDSVQGACYAKRRKVLRLPHDPGIDLTTAIDGVILALWNLKKEEAWLNTYEIAKKVGLHEAEVANRLARMLDGEARQ
jgi:hypothetical protein